MKITLDSLFNLDRRIIFIVIFLAVLIPFLFKFVLPIKPDKYVLGVYNAVETVAAKNGTVLLSFDFDPASKAELEPMARAILSHMFAKNIKVVAMGHWMTGVGLAERILQELAKEYGKTYGKDWAFLGWKTGAGILVLNMGQDFASAFPKDAKGNDIKSLEITRNILTLKDFDLVVSLAAGSGGVDMWVDYGQSRYGFKLAGGCTAVMAPDFFPYLQSGQIVGLIGGLVGAAQYEALVQKPGSATKGMNSQSISHIVLIFFIVFGNICYFANKYMKRKTGLAKA